MNRTPLASNQFAATVRGALCALKSRCVEKNEVFPSEKHFQFELAVALRCAGMVNVEMESPQDEILGPKKKVDILADGVALELKYFTTPDFRAVWNGEDFEAPGTPRLRSDQYNFWKDVWRVERLLAHRKAKIGFVVCLSNYSAIWEGTVGRTKPDWFADFRMRDGKVFPQELKLGDGKKPKHWAKRPNVIRLSREYALHWEEWCDLGAGVDNGRFRHVVLEITP